MNVFHLIKSLGRGGAETLLSETLRVSDGSVRYSYGFFLKNNRAVERDLQEQGASVVCFDADSSAGVLMRFSRVAEFLRQSKPDIIHCHLALAGIVGRIAGKLTGIPVIYTEHTKFEHCHFCTRIASRLTWRWQKRVIAVSNEVKTSIETHLGNRVPIQVVENGIDVLKFRRNGTDGAKIRQHFDISPDAPVIGTVAVFREVKRLNLWLQVAQKVRKLREDAVFMIVGFGPLEDSLKNEAAALGLSHNLFFPGYQTDVRQYLECFDIYLMTSLYEGLPIALLEAMAMECAPVCTSAGGIGEIIEHGYNGLCVSPQSPDRLVDHIAFLLKSGSEQSRIAINARQTVVEKYNITRMVEKLEGIYEDCLRPRPENRRTVKAS